MTARGARRGRPPRAAPWATRPLADTGLPPRILAVLRAAGCRTCGDWAAAPAAADSPKLPDADRAWTRRIAAALAPLARGKLEPMPFSRWLSTLLPDRWHAALSHRRALDAEGAAPSLHDIPLARVGAALGITRERARQLLDLSRAFLAAPLAQTLAAPLYDAARTTLDAAGGALSPAEWLQAAGDSPLWADISPAGALLVLHDAAPARIVLHRGLFASIPPDALDALDTRLHDALRQAGGLLPLATIPGAPPALYNRLAQTLPGVLVLRDGRGGLLDRDAPRLLREILLVRGPLRLDAITAAYNALACPASQRGIGLVRQWLLADPAVHRPAPNLYALAPGYQPTLFASP